MPRRMAAVSVAPSLSTDDDSLMGPSAGHDLSNTTPAVQQHGEYERPLKTHTSEPEDDEQPYDDQTLLAHTQKIFTPATFPCGRTIPNRLVKVCDSFTGERVLSLDGHDSMINAVEWIIELKIHERKETEAQFHTSESAFSPRTPALCPSSTILHTESPNAARGALRKCGV